MRVTQGTFSFLPDLTDEQIAAQIHYALDHGWAISVEHTDDPHPRNAYWELWNLPLFDLRPDQADVAMREVQACRERFPDHYVKVIAYDATLHAPDHRAGVHRQPAARGAALPARADRRPRPLDALRCTDTQPSVRLGSVRMSALRHEVDAVLDELDAELVALAAGQDAHP